MADDFFRHPDIPKNVRPADLLDARLVGKIEEVYTPKPHKGKSSKRDYAAWEDKWRADKERDEEETEEEDAW